MTTHIYNRQRALEYAIRWAYRRNPLFYDFEEIGGNCTSFVSQCILAGTCTMNFTPNFGWYYISPEDRAPSWTGVEFLYNFLTSNESVGPFGVEIPLDEVQTGDVIQLADDTGDFYHSLLVCERDSEDILVASQSNDSLFRPLSSYSFSFARGIHVGGYRTGEEKCDCFPSLYRGESFSPCLRRNM